MAGRTLKEQNANSEIIPDYYSVKEAVFPFNKFPGVDPILGPEMKSTGEVMGVGRSFGEAYAKSQIAAGISLPHDGRAFLSVRDTDKTGIVEVGRQLLELGFELVATHGTAKVLRDAGLECEGVNKVTEGRPHIVDMIKNDEINLIINTTEGSQAIADSATIRSNALQHKVTYTTTLTGGLALCRALKQTDISEVNRLQDLHQEISA
jgi:carbamoyl-phosphate synthase large subunit